MRTYKTDADDRGKIDYFDEFCRSAISFENCYCSAPSTVMSVSSMMTAIPAVYHSTSYDHFDKNSAGFETFPGWLQKQGFITRSILFFPEGREHLTHLMGDTLERFWPSGKNSRFWTNEDISSVFKKALSEADPKEKNFFYAHFNIRHDPNTNYWVKRSIEDFEAKFDNAVIILTSDHGYPDPTRGIDQKSMIYHGHDLLMTDDNVRVPLAIKGIDANNIPNISESLVSLIDIAPTLQRIIDPCIIKTLNGDFPDSGIDIFENNRCSLEIFNRYMFQPNQQIRFVGIDDTFMISDSEIYTKHSAELGKYDLTTNQKVKLLERLDTIRSHFKTFLQNKVEKLEKDSVIYCSNPPPNINYFINEIIDFPISITNDLGKIKDGSPVYILKASDNLFQTLKDIKSLKKSKKSQHHINILSLNLDIITIPKNRGSVVFYLFYNKFLPRFLANPIFTIRELIIVLRKISR